MKHGKQPGTRKPGNQPGTRKPGTKYFETPTATWDPLLRNLAPFSPFSQTQRNLAPFGPLQPGTRKPGNLAPFIGKPGTVLVVPIRNLAPFPQTSPIKSCAHQTETWHPLALRNLAPFIEKPGTVLADIAD